ncbi:DnaA ATPase domain-containing protein [Parvularcula marina]|uniref:DnaA ATPase domain-containing protein n=1 Tax=Parvularcula marina TaxID=2292771 RepID=UPI00351706F6
MTQENQETKLAAFRDGLKDFYGTDIYTSYFDPIDVGEYDSRRATLFAKNRLAADRISTRFATGVHALWCEHFGPVETIEICEGSEGVQMSSVIRAEDAAKQASAALMARPAREISAAPLPESDEETTQPSDNSLNVLVNAMQTLDNFCVNETNRMARLATEQVIEGSGAPVTYLYGNNGYGKSHLLNAACNEYSRRFPGRRIMYITYESLVADVSDAVVSNSIKDLRAHLNDTDLLVFDDVQLLRGRKRTQEELACLMERFQPLGKPILVAGALSPGELAETGISPRLTERLKGGASIRIGKPDAILRLRIVNRSAEQFTARTGTEIPQRHLDYIARRCDVSVRELLGILRYFEIAIVARDNDGPITDEWVREILSEKLASQKAQTTLEDVFSFTASTFGVTSADLRSKSRRRELVRARQAFCLSARKLTDESLKAIGSMIARDHTTVMHSIDQAEIFSTGDKTFGHKINTIFDHFGL